MNPVLVISIALLVSDERYIHYFQSRDDPRQADRGGTNHVESTTHITPAPFADWNITASLGQQGAAQLSTISADLFTASLRVATREFIAEPILVQQWAVSHYAVRFSLTTPHSFSAQFGSESDVTAIGGGPRPIPEPTLLYHLTGPSGDVFSIGNQDGAGTFSGTLLAGDYLLEAMLEAGNTVRPSWDYIEQWAAMQMSFSLSEPVPESGLPLWMSALLIIGLLLMKTK